VARARAAEAAALARLADSYGKVPVAQFDADRAAIQPVHPENYETFREDYEITGAATGTVTVSYGAGCEVCGLNLDFTHVHPIPGLDEHR
jgi:hypothetical protein